MTEDELEKLDKIQAAITNAKEPTNDPLFRLHHHAYNFAEKPAAPPSASVIQKDPILSRFEDLCAKNGVSEAVKNRFESSLTDEQISFVMHLWNSGKWSEHIKAMELLGIPVTEKDREIAKQEEDRQSTVLNMVTTAMAVGAASSLLPRSPSGNNLEALAVENSEGAAAPGEEVEEKTEGDLLIPSAILTSTPTD